MQISHALQSLVPLAVLPVFAQVGGAQSYTIVDLGSLSTNPLHEVHAVALNDRGHVHGTNELNGVFGSPKVHSFLWDGALQHIWPITPTLSLGGGVNDLDQVATASYPEMWPTPFWLELVSSDSSMTNESLTVSSEFADRWHDSKSATSLSTKTLAVRPCGDSCVADRQVAHQRPLSPRSVVRGWLERSGCCPAIDADAARDSEQ